MKKKVDFLIRYEHKVRELECIMLIKMELERRGYSVALVGNYEYNNTIKYQPKVFVSPAIYCDNNVKSDFVKYGVIKKVANLLWEQLIGIEDEESPNCTHNVIGIGRKILTFCWGNQTRDRIIKGGVKPDRALVTGQISLDLFKNDFRSSFMTKESLASKYNLDVNKEWILFISSFAFCELDEIQKRLLKIYIGQDNYDYMVNLSNQSRNDILQWFELILEKYPNKILIYRPHPDEVRKSGILREMEAKYPNFRVVSGEALKQWVNISHKVYNWYSTGIVDAVVMKKPYRMLRPVEIKREQDYRIFYEAEKITSLEEFIEDYTNYDFKEVINKKLFDYYYHTSGEFSYYKVCDLLEDLLKTDKYDIEYSFKEYFTFFLYVQRRRFIIGLSKSFPFIKTTLKRLGLFKQYFKNSDIRNKVLEEGYEKNVVNNDDIREISIRLSPIIYGRMG